MSLTALGIEAVERGFVPDVATRAAIRRMCSRTAAADRRTGDEDREAATRRFVDEMRRSPIALSTDFANRQHYEVPAEFFASVLGPRLKYSCCEWEGEADTLEAAEIRALETTCRRASLADGQDVLELGCGWGSLSLWMAERFPNSRIVAVSNSRSQRRYVESVANDRGLGNLRVVTADMNDFDANVVHRSGFDRVVSIEMFEHMRNYERLLDRIADWLRADGKLFVHVFAHRRMAYAFETSSDVDWMGRHFFTGGMMPANDLLPRFDRRFRLADCHEWNGVHYRRTADAWLSNFDAKQRELEPIFATTYGRESRRWRHRWRMFFLAVSELFGFDQGREWFVSHYLFDRK